MACGVKDDGDLRTWIIGLRGAEQSESGWVVAEEIRNLDTAVWACFAGLNLRRETVTLL